MRDEPWLQQVAGQAAGGGLHKCLQADRVLYTDAPCPTGSRAQGVAGQLSVVPAAPAPAGASAPNGARPLLRQMDTGELRQRQMDAVIGQ
jgi:hypothetical protein